MFLKWLIFAFSSFVGLFAFQWIFYTGFEWSKTRSAFGYVFPNLFTFFLFWSFMIAVVLAPLNAASWSIASLAFNEWFHKAWILHLTLLATSGISGALVFWMKFGEIPSRGVLIGLSLYAAGAVISAFWR
ncbi:MAG: hypothetical protein AAB527_00010 [Patescibacteria group bacterium]